MGVRNLQPLALGLILLGISLMGSTRPTLSQDSAGSCQPQVEQALEQVGDLCDGLSRNSACYGNASIKATFVDSESADQFAKPGDTTNVTRLQSIETAPLDESAKVWGVSLLRLQANIPDTLPGQGVVFVLFGDVGVENAVAAEDAFVPAAESVPVKTRSAANIRSNASTNGNVLLSVPAGTELPADATSPDKDWLRVVSDITVGWISKGVVNVPASRVNQLPVLTHSSRTAMQSFYLTSTLSNVGCAQAPPLVVVQGPDHVSVDVTVDGIDINMASTIVLRLLNPRTLEVIAVHGTVRVGGIPLPIGFAVSVPLSADGHQQEGDFQDIHPLSQPELDQIISVEMIPANVLNYPINLPTLSEINRQVAALGGGGGVVSAAAASHVACRSLRATSPLDGWGRKSTAFYWDAARGATGYHLVIDKVTIIDTTSTNATVDLNGVGTESLTWSVQALYNGEVACQTRPLTIPRDAGASSSAPGQNCYYDMTTYSMVCN